MGQIVTVKYELSISYTKVVNKVTINSNLGTANFGNTGKSDVFTDLCCYNTETKQCTKDPGSASDPIVCPTVTTTIVNNCGMAGIYQPVTAERCTEISLVDGYCCFLKTKNGETACVKKKEIDEDDKNMITDVIKKYLQENNNYADSYIESLKCKGFLLKNLLSSILFLLVITMI